MISVITVLFAALVSTYTFLFPEEVADSEYTLKMSNNQFAVRYNNDLPQPYQPPMSQLSMQVSFKMGETTQV